MEWNGMSVCYDRVLFAMDAVCGEEEDRWSARRDLEDPEMLSVLERCYRLLQGRRSSTASSTGAAGPPMTPAQPAATLARHLTRHVFETVRLRVTSRDHCLYDVIWPSVKRLPADQQLLTAMEDDLPWGLIAPDHRAYTCFRELLEPALREMHCLHSAAELAHPPARYFPTVGPDESCTFTCNLDTSGKWVVAGAIELCRNLVDREFASCLSISELERVERQLLDQVTQPRVLEALQENLTAEEVSALGPGTYHPLEEVLEGGELASSITQAGLMLPLWTLGERLHGRHWPYGRGVYLTAERNAAAWINVLEHLRLIIRTPLAKPADLGTAYSRLAKIARELDSGLEWRRDARLGHMTVRPQCVGNGLQFRLHLRLPQLSKERDNLRHLCWVRGLTLREERDRLRVSNQPCLGVSELQSFEDFATAVSNILQLEKDLAMHNSLHIAQLFVSIFRRNKRLTAGAGGSGAERDH